MGKKYYDLSYFAIIIQIIRSIERRGGMRGRLIFFPHVFRTVVFF